MLLLVRVVSSFEPDSALVNLWFSQQFGAQRHAQAMPHAAGAAPVRAGFALQYGGDQGVAWLGCFDFHVDRLQRRVWSSETARVLAHPGPWLASRDDSATRYLARCASPALRGATTRCSFDGGRERACRSRVVGCADDKCTLPHVKPSQRRRFRGATPLRARCHSAVPSSEAANVAAAVACGARASPSNSSSRARARSG
jgi:hypothetical protein